MICFIQLGAASMLLRTACLVLLPGAIQLSAVSAWSC